MWRYTKWEDWSLTITNSVQVFNVGSFKIQHLQHLHISILVIDKGLGLFVGHKTHPSTLLKTLLHDFHSFKNLMSNEAETSTGKLYYTLHSQWVGIHVTAKNLIYKIKFYCPTMGNSLGLLTALKLQNTQNTTVKIMENTTQWMSQCLSNRLHHGACSLYQGCMMCFPLFPAQKMT